MIFWIIILLIALLGIIVVTLILIGAGVLSPGKLP